MRTHQDQARFSLLITSRDNSFKNELQQAQFSKLVIPAGIAGIQATWMGLSLSSLALDTRFLAGMT
jgi:hypothetical protein